MDRGLWATATPPDGELGVVAHGPALLGRDPGIVAGLRCVFAHPTGLRLLVVVRAVDVQAEAAHRQYGYGELRADVPTVRPGPPATFSFLALRATVNGRSSDLEPYSESSSSSPDHYLQESDYWIGELPEDDLLGLAVSWPATGLAASWVDLVLPGVRELAATAIPLG